MDKNSRIQCGNCKHASLASEWNETTRLSLPKEHQKNVTPIQDCWMGNSHWFVCPVCNREIDNNPSHMTLIEDISISTNLEAKHLLEGG